MNPSASVESIAALRDWHAALCVFRTEALESLASAALEIQRADSWLDDQARHWQSEARDGEEDVLRCRNELAQRQFPDYSGRIPDCSVQEEALWRAEARLEYIKEQIEIVRRWYTRLPKLINEEYDGAARRLTNFLEGDVPRGLALLQGRIGSLEAYVGIKPQAIPTPAATPEKGKP
ncbi:MAG: hypothetical protein K8T89_11710 [Planctomycetes bacterium]|nr:hypothetical protein [Planctomycetota bacterium]